MADNKRIDEATGTSTVGHEWDGIEELDTPMPRWWLYALYASIVWGIIYVILYPAWPLINDATKGTLGWTSRGELQEQLDARAKELEPIKAALSSKNWTEISNDKALMRAAIEGGRSAFKVHCVQCHGGGATGSKGYPNLNDDDWLWGGTIEDIEYSIAHGIRNPDLPKTRQSAMPAFGRDGILPNGDIAILASYVRQLAGKEKPNKNSVKAKELFINNCAACHGENGTGNQQLGAPNLADAITLYGMDSADVTATITNSRAGVMPAWEARLDPVTVKMLAAYVHSLGGGVKIASAPLEADEKGADAASDAVTEDAPSAEEG